MTGFLVAAGIALICLLSVTAEDWWPLWQRILSALAVLAAVLLCAGGIGYLWLA